MTNRFKGLDLVDRVPEQLWTEVSNTVQEVVTKTIAKKKKCKKTKGLSEAALQITYRRRKGGNVPLYIQLGMSFLAKGKGETERYTQLNVEFKRIHWS